MPARILCLKKNSRNKWSEIWRQISSVSHKFHPFSLSEPGDEWQTSCRAVCTHSPLPLSWVARYHSLYPPQKLRNTLFKYSFESSWNQEIKTRSYQPGTRGRKVQTRGVLAGLLSGFIVRIGQQKHLDLLWHYCSWLLVRSQNTSGPCGDSVVSRTTICLSSITVKQQLHHKIKKHLTMDFDLTSDPLTTFHCFFTRKNNINCHVTLRVNSWLRPPTGESGLKTVSCWFCCCLLTFGHNYQYISNISSSFCLTDNAESSWAAQSERGTSFCRFEKMSKAEQTKFRRSWGEF